MPSQDRIEAAISALETHRRALGDDTTDAALAALKNQLEPNLGSGQTLRQVTILFLDTVGSTTLSRTLDPEDIHSILDGALRRLSAMVKSHGGRVLQFAGDSLLAVFGADVSREDDPIRAVGCALGLVKASRLIQEELQAFSSGRNFDVRIGIHTGSVLLGGGVDGAATIRGIAVNIAARMEQTAPPGAIRISHETFRHVRGVFRLSDETPVAVKGFPEPIHTHLVLGAEEGDTTARRGIDGITTPLVGRDEELRSLLCRWEEIVRLNTVGITLLVGDPGVGKSRLLLEFERHAKDRAPHTVFLRARVQPYSASVPYGVLRDLLLRHAGVHDTDAMDLARCKVHNAFDAVLPSSGKPLANALLELLGITDTKQDPASGHERASLRRDGFAAASTYMRALASTSTGAIIVVEDLHWADDGSFDFVRHLAASAPGCPVLVVCSARPELPRPHTEWASHLSRMDLAPLSASTSRQLTDVLLARVDNVTPALADLVIKTAEGNPYFIEELIGVLIADGVIVVQADGWRVDAERVTSVRVPTTLAGVIQARLDALPTTQRALLQRASIIGPVFWDAALSRLSPLQTIDLASLVESGLVRPREPSAFEDAEEYGFKHHLLHQVAYAGVLKRDRRPYHRLVAEWLVERSGDRTGEYHGLIAEHYERAGDNAMTLLHLLKAADHAAKAFANEAAIDFVRRALKVVPTGDAETQFALIDIEHRVFTRQGRRREQAASLQTLERLAHMLNDDAKRAKVMGSRAQYESETGDKETASAAAAMAIALANKAGMPQAALGARIELANILHGRGKFEEAAAEAETAVQAARALGNRSAEAAALIQLALSAAGIERRALGRQYLEDALTVVRKAGDKLVECVVLYHQAEAQSQIGRLRDAERILTEALEVARSTGWRLIERLLLSSLSTVLLSQGESRRALAAARAASAIELEDTDRASFARARLAEGYATLACNDAPAALLCFRDAQPIYRDVGTHFDQATALAGLAAADSALGNHEEAMQAVVEAIAVLESQTHADPDDDVVRFFFICHQVSRAAADSRSEEFLARAWEAMMRRADLLDGSERRHFLDEVDLHRDVSARWSDRGAKSR